MCARLRAGFKGALYSSFTAKSTFELPFQVTFREYPVSGNVAHFFPLRVLHLDLTFWKVSILLTFFPSQGKLATVVYRRNRQEVVRFNGGYRF